MLTSWAAFRTVILSDATISRGTKGGGSQHEHPVRPKGADPKEPAEPEQRHWQGGKASPYLKDGQPLTWLQVQELVAGLMKERTITFTSTSDLQHKLPALIFSLQQEIDELKGEKAAAKAKK